MKTFQSDLFAGRQALVAGGTRGIGAAIANHLAALGATVVAGGLEDTDGSLSHSIRVAHLDVTSEQSVRDVFDPLDRLDILVNCAGIIRRHDEHQPEIFERVLAVNLTGSMRTCTAARPLLKKTGGAIVNTASMLSFFGGGLVPGYAASKGGIAQLTKSLALAYAADGVRVNAIAPGWIATALTQNLQDNKDRSQAILERTPLGRWGTPDDLGGAVAFLCSPAAAFVTGVILPVDGGYLVA